MASLAELVTVCKTAIQGGAALLGKLQARRLTNEQVTLLAHAAKLGPFQGMFHIIEVDQELYPIVKAGGSSFAKPGDRAARARYCDAFKQLCGRAYVQWQSEQLFTLTSAGFAKAGKLSSE